MPDLPTLAAQVAQEIVAKCTHTIKVYIGHEDGTLTDGACALCITQALAGQVETAHAAGRREGLEEAVKIADTICRRVWGHELHDKLSLTCSMPGHKIANELRRRAAAGGGG